MDGIQLMHSKRCHCSPGRQKVCWPAWPLWLQATAAGWLETLETVCWHAAGEAGDLLAMVAQPTRSADRNILWHGIDDSIVGPEGQHNGCDGHFEEALLTVCFVLVVWTCWLSGHVCS